MLPLLNRIKLYLSIVGAFLIALAVAFLRGKQFGINQSETRTNEQILQNTKEAKDVAVEVDAMDDATVRDELREWTVD